MGAVESASELPRRALDNNDRSSYREVFGTIERLQTDSRNEGDRYTLLHGQLFYIFSCALLSHRSLYY